MIFVDGGSFDGRTVRAFRKHWPGASAYAIHCFEPDVRFSNHEPDITLHRAALWIHDGQIPLYLGKPQASSVMTTKTTGNLDFFHPSLVPCIDFSSWLGELDSGEIVVKLNIEGAEYPVLRRLIEHKTICAIAKLFVEWHWQKIGVAKETHEQLIRDLTACGVPPVEICGTDWLETL